MLNVNIKLLNIILLSIGFMVIYASFNPVTTINKVTYDSIHDEDPNFTADGYYVYATMFITVAISDWLAPLLISVTGPKFALIFGSFLYISFVLVLLMPQNELMYLAAILNGFGAALLWTANGIYMTINSNEKTITRNTGIFWALLQLGQMLGQIFVYCVFRNITTIDKNTRTKVFGSLSGITAISIPLFYNLRVVDGTYRSDFGPITALKKSFALLTVKIMNLLLLPIIFSGLAVTFYYGVYSAAIGFTMKFGSHAKSFMALYGIFFGMGSVTGAVTLGITNDKITRWGRYPIVTVGMLIFLLSFLLTFLNLPKDSPLMETDEDAFILSTVELAMFCAFILGIGDSIINTQIIAIISVVFFDNCVSAFALFKFFQSLVVAIAFIYSTHINLYWQIFILTIFAVGGNISYYFAERVYDSEKYKMGKDITSSTETI